MNHYSKHRFIVLTPEQQALVEKVSKGIYRPLLREFRLLPRLQSRYGDAGAFGIDGLARGVEDEMYKAALAVNSYWFPDTYITIAKYLKSQGKDWSAAVPKEILGYNYSSGPGYQKLLEKIENPEIKGGGGGCFRFNSPIQGLPLDCRIIT